MIVIEAMKMENDLIAPFDGTVGKIFVSSGDPVEKSVVLMVIERTP